MVLQRKALKGSFVGLITNIIEWWFVWFPLMPVCICVVSYELLIGLNDNKDDVSGLVLKIIVPFFAAFSIIYSIAFDMFPKEQQVAPETIREVPDAGEKMEKSKNNHVEVINQI